MLAIDNLTAGYGQGTILVDVSLRVDAGKVVCLVGRNGVGKTTLLKTVVGILRPHSGGISIDGVDVTKWPAYRRARAGIGYVPQGRMVFPQLTVYENLLIGLEAAATFDAGQVAPMLELFPKLKELANRAAGKLSGGEQQQLAIARALVSRPKILLLDEPTEGIQPSVVDEIAAALRSIRDQQGVAMLLAEQFLDFASGLADSFYVIEGGHIVAHGDAGVLSEQDMHEYLSV